MRSQAGKKRPPARRASGGRLRSQKKQRWETLVWIGVDAGTISFGDADADRDLIRTRGLQDDGRTRYGVSTLDFGGSRVMLFNTKEDGEYPIEAIRGPDGEFQSFRSA